MWWAAALKRSLQAIQDRWRIARCLIGESKDSKPTQMAIPLQMDTFQKQLVAASSCVAGLKPDNTFKRSRP
jgi:hypothetical protein